MTLLSWHVAGREQRQPEQAELIAELAPDLVCLQEVRPTTANAWTAALSAEVSAPEVTYLHAWRDQGLSDHSPLLATLHW